MDACQERSQVLLRLQRAAGTLGCPGQTVELGHPDLRLFCSRPPLPWAAENDLPPEYGGEEGAGAADAAALAALAGSDGTVSAGGNGAGAVASEGWWLYRPGLIFVVAGTKEITAGSRRYVIEAGEYFLNCVSLPARVRNLADPGVGAFLSISFPLDLGRFNYVRSTFTMRRNLEHKTRIRPLSRERGISQYRALDPEAREAGRIIEVMSCSYDMLCVLERAVDLRRYSCPDQLPSIMTIHMLLFHLLLSPHSGFMILRRLKEENLTAVDKAIRFMLENPGWDFDAEKLSKVHGLEPYIFTRHFSAETGLPPLRWFNQVRMMLLRELMFNKKLSLDRAMRRLGIKSSDQIITAWRQLFGQPPARDVRVIRQLLQGRRGQSPAAPGPYGLIFPDV